MPPKPTREELLAQIAALQAQVREQDALAPFVQEVSGIAPANQPDKKTSQTVRAPTPQQAALLRSLLPGAPKTTDPIVIQGQIDGLKSLIISGVNSAGYGDKRTEFRSLSDLRQILNDLEEDLAAALGFGGRVRQIRMTTQADKGL
jgi:hypothetical protein